MRLEQRLLVEVADDLVDRRIAGIGGVEGHGRDLDVTLPDQVEVLLVAEKADQAHPVAEAGLADRRHHHEGRGIERGVDVVDLGVGAEIADDLLAERGGDLAGGELAGIDRAALALGERVHHALVLGHHRVELAVGVDDDVRLAAGVLDDPLADRGAERVVVDVDGEGPGELAVLEHRQRVRRVAALAESHHGNARLLRFLQRQLDGPVVDRGGDDHVRAPGERVEDGRALRLRVGLAVEHVDFPTDELGRLGGGIGLHLAALDRGGAGDDADLDPGRRLGRLGRAVEGIRIGPGGEGRRREAKGHAREHNQCGGTVPESAGLHSGIPPLMAHRPVTLRCRDARPPDRSGGGANGTDGGIAAGPAIPLLPAISLPEPLTEGVQTAMTALTIQR